MAVMKMSSKIYLRVHFTFVANVWQYWALF